MRTSQNTVGGQVVSATLEPSKLKKVGGNSAGDSTKLTGKIKEKVKGSKRKKGKTVNAWKSSRQRHSTLDRGRVAGKKGIYSGRNTNEL